MTKNAEIVIATTLRGRREANGVQTQFFTFYDYLSDAGHPVRIVSALSYYRIIVYPVLAIKRLIGIFSARAALRWHRWWRFWLIRAVMRGVCAAGNDIVVYAQDSLTAEAALEVRRGDQPVILAMHNTRSEADEWVDHGVISKTSAMYEAMRRREREVLPRVDRLIFTSESQRTAIASIFPEITTIPSAIIPEFVPVPESNGGTRVRDAITVGVLEQRKNHRFLIDVIAAARSLGHIFTLTIVGEGPERGALQARIRELGLEGQVALVGRVGHNIGLELEKHRVYLHSSRRESFGLAVVEAMAAGLPTIIGDTGVAELLRGGEETWIWPDLDDPQRGAELLISVMADPSKRDAVAERGRQRYDQSFSIGKIAPLLRDSLLERQPLHVTPKP